MAIMSVRWVSKLQLFLTLRHLFFFLQRDKVVLRPNFSFLRKVVSYFLFHEYIVLPFLCTASEHDKEIALPCLDVAVAVRVYLAAKDSFRKKSFSLFCL